MDADHAPRVVLVKPYAVLVWILARAKERTTFALANSWSVEVAALFWVIKAA